MKDIQTGTIRKLGCSFLFAFYSNYGRISCYFTRAAIHVWCKKVAQGRESVVDEEEPGHRVVSTTDATIAAVDSFMRSDRRVMA